MWLRKGALFVPCLCTAWAAVGYLVAKVFG